MIKFYFEDQFSGAKAAAQVTTQAENLPAVVSAFKVFLALAGYHPDNIATVTVADDVQSFREGDGNPDQGDFFSDEHEEGGI